MNKKLAGKIAWISGAASGMGEAIAELFASEGASVAVADVQEEGATAVVERLRARGGRVLASPCNVGDGAQVERSISETAAQFGGLDIVVNCAGIVHVAPLHEYDEAQWDQLMCVNVKAIYLSTKYAMPHLRQRARSYIVNIASASSFIGQALTPAYTASKHAALGLTRSIALDYAALGLRCNCICPGITDTPMLRFHLSAASDPEAALAQRLQRVPMGTALQPSDIAKAALYFACEDSSGITGTSLVVDGGWTACAEWQVEGQTRFMEDEVDEQDP